MVEHDRVVEQERPRGQIDRVVPFAQVHRLVRLVVLEYDLPWLDAGRAPVHLDDAQEPAPDDVAARLGNGAAVAAALTGAPAAPRHGRFAEWPRPHGAAHIGAVRNKIRERCSRRGWPGPLACSTPLHRSPFMRNMRRVGAGRRRGAGVGTRSAATADDRVTWRLGGRKNGCRR